MTTKTVRSAVRFITVNLRCLTQFSLKVAATISVFSALLLIVVLLPPVIIVFGLMAREQWRIATESIWPHDSDRAWIVLGFPAMVAALNAYGIFYGLVGLTNALQKSLVLNAIIIIPLISYFLVNSKRRQELAGLLIWVIEICDRSVTVATSFSYGLLEPMPKVLARFLNAACFLAIPSAALYLITKYISSIELAGSEAKDLANHFFVTTALIIFVLIALFVTLGTRRYIISRPRFLGDTIPRLEQFEPLPGILARETIRVAHLSDLHIPRKTKLTEEGKWDSRVLDDCVTHLRLQEKQAQLTAIVFSGDITDTGHPDAWKKFNDKFQEFKSLIVLAPGNHDLNIIGYGVPSIFLVGDKLGCAGRWVRMKAFMDSAVMLMDDRAQVWSGGKLEKLTDAWVTLQGNSELSGKDRLQASFDLFPLVVTVPGQGESKNFIVWNTVRTSTLALNNSYGTISQRQLDNFEKISDYLSRDTKTKSSIHVMHHKLGLPLRKLKSKNNTEIRCIAGRASRSMKQIVQLAGMTMLNAQKVVPTIMKGDCTVVLHGHHHASFYGQLAQNEKIMHVISAPSTTLGTEFYTDLPRSGLGFDMLDLAKTSGGWALAQKPFRVKFPKR